MMVITMQRWFWRRYGNDAGIVLVTVCEMPQQYTPDLPERLKMYIILDLMQQVQGKNLFLTEREARQDAIDTIESERAALLFEIAGLHGFKATNSST